MTDDKMPDLPEDALLLGSGVWGDVYDLGDGTVVKAVRAEGGGIGNPAAKLVHESRVLRQLGILPEARGLIPGFLGEGSADARSGLARRGYAFWLRIEKMKGAPVSVSDLRTMTPSQKGGLIDGYAEALAKVHLLMDRSGIVASLKPDGLLTDSSLDGFPLTFPDRERLGRMRQIFASLPAGSDRAIHGDFNISNLLVNDQGRVSGVLDFAEACRGCAEDDIAGLTAEIPEMTELFAAAYEAAAGVKLDKKRLEIARALRDLCSVLICEYKIGQPAEAQQNRVRLDSFLSHVPKH